MKILQAVLPEKTKITSGHGGQEFAELPNGLKVIYSGDFSETYTITHFMLFTSASFKDKFITKKLISILTKKDGTYFLQFRYMADILQNLRLNKEFVD